MAIPPEKLAQSLEILRKLQTAEGAGAIRARDLSRTHRERLLRNGFLQEVIKGWYIPSRPDEAKGESTAWYASFWRFCGAYLEVRFGVRWCLSPEQSLSLHAGNWTVPGQLAARSPRADNKVTKLPHGTSLLELRIAPPGVADRKEEAGLRLFSVEAALIACSPNYFSNDATDVRSVLPMIRDASGLLAQLLEGGHTVIAGRLAGAFRNIGRDRIADDIVRTMTAAGYAVRENDPFTDKPSLIIGARETSPYVNRLRLLWQKMREPVIERFPKAPGPPRNIEAYLKRVNDAYVTDAYHSLSIEGYRVTPALIERVRGGTRNLEADEGDREQRNHGGAGLLAGLSGRAEKPRENSEGGKSGRGRRRGPQHVVSRAIRPQRHCRPAEARRSRGLSRRPGLYPQVDACAAEPERGEGRHAGVLRPATGRAAPGRPRGARALYLRLHPSLYGRQRPRRALPDEHHDGVGRIPVDGHSGNRPQRLRERSRKSERRRRYRVLRELPRRVGEEAAGGRAVASGAESLARRRTLKQFSICRECASRVDAENDSTREDAAGARGAGINDPLFLEEVDFKSFEANGETLAAAWDRRSRAMTKCSDRIALRRQCSLLADGRFGWGMSAWNFCDEVLRCLFLWKQFLRSEDLLIPFLDSFRFADDTPVTPIVGSSASPTQE